MRIGIDARTIAEGGGCQNYVINLINNLSERENIDLIIFYNTKKLLGTFKNNNCREVALFPSKKFLLLVYDLIILPYYAKKYKVDILHLPKSSCNFSKKIKKITTWHDLLPITLKDTEKFLNKLYFRLNFWLASKYANKIITDSYFSKKEIIKKYGVSNNKIKVIYFGINNIFTKNHSKKGINNIKSKYKLPEKFIIFVGTIQPRKNIKRVLQALNKINKNLDKKIYLVIAGRTGWKVAAEILDNPYIIKLGFVPYKDLPLLYKTADMAVYVSLGEGFGIPIIEAQACGCPVITSNISCMPEIAGKGAILVNPYNADEISRAMLKILRDKDIKNGLVKKGLENIKRFSWKKCAEKTLNIYQEIYNDKN